MSDARPIVKWAGGKGQRLDRLRPMFPAKFNRYIEPFAGADAVGAQQRNLPRCFVRGCEAISVSAKGLAAAHPCVQPAQTAAASFPTNCP